MEFTKDLMYQMGQNRRKGRQKRIDFGASIGRVCGEGGECWDEVLFDRRKMIL